MSELDSNSWLWSQILSLIYSRLCNGKNAEKIGRYKVITLFIKLRKLIKVTNHGYYIHDIYAFED